MSRSKRKTKMRAITTASSEKKNKQEANRKLRRLVKLHVKKKNTEMPKLREISNVWSFDKDGKAYRSEMTERELRK